MVEVLQEIDTPSLVEQVIVVPKISLDRIPQRSAVRRPKKAKQLVGLPTEPGHALVVVATKALGQQRHWPRKSLTIQFLVVEVVVDGGASSVEQIVDFPVPRGEGLQGLRPGQNSTFRLVEQNVDIPVPAGGLKGFFFGLFPGVKKSPKPAPSPMVPTRSSSWDSSGSWPSSLLGLGRARRCGVLLLEPTHWDDFLEDAGWLAAWLGNARRWLLCTYISSLRWCTSPLTNFDWWCAVSVLGAAQGCPCDHAARVPSVQVVRVLAFQLCHRRRFHSAVVNAVVHGKSETRKQDEKKFKTRRNVEFSSATARCIPWRVNGHSHGGNLSLQKRSQEMWIFSNLKLGVKKM